MEWKYGVDATGLKGNVDRSFLHEGVNHIAEFSFMNKRPLVGGQQLETTGVFRYTDDPRVDPERNSLQRAYARWTGPSFELIAGDSLVNYSRFSFNHNVKGLSLRKDLDIWGGLRLTGTAAAFSDRWGAIFRGFEKFTDYRSLPDPTNPSKPYTRMVLGFRGEKPLGENRWVGVNYSQGSDIIRSLPGESRVAPFNNQLFSVDWALGFRRNLRLSGELAYSGTEFDPRFQHGKSWDYALRVEVSQQGPRYRWRAEYNRFMPNFFSVNARQVQDLQDVSAQGTVDFTKQLSLTASFRRTSNNLPGDPVVELVPRRVCSETSERLLPQILPNTSSDRSREIIECSRTGQLVTFQLLPFNHVVDSEGGEMTTVVRLPEVRLTVRSLPFWQRLVVELGFRERALETSNKGSFSTDTQTDSTTGDTLTFLTPLFRERATKIPYAEINFPVGNQQFKFTYEYRRNRDRVQPGNSTFTHRAMAQYRLPPLYIGAWTVSGDVRFETERESKQVELETLDVPDPQTGQRVRLRQSAGDQTRSLQGSLNLEFPKFFTLELLYRELNAELLSAFTADGVRRFGTGGYRRPKFRAQLQYRIGNSENRFFLFTVERNVNTFDIPDPSKPDDRSFREKLAQITFVWRFRR
ncbi:MAG: hypothetical protein HY653_07560 [Acidobacteria bacterium]|nr:hypothetical protein [Acidobacteriota bacterium]